MYHSVILSEVEGSISQSVIIKMFCYQNLLAKQLPCTNFKLYLHLFLFAFYFYLVKSFAIYSHYIAL